MSDMTVEKRGRKSFVESQFNEFLQVNKQTIRKVSDISELYDVYVKWAPGKAMAESSFVRMMKTTSNAPEIQSISFKKSAPARLSLVEQFAVLEGYVGLAHRGILNSLFVCGIAGIGKTETVKQKLSSLNAQYEFFSGGVKDAYSIAKILYDNRENKVIVFDDFDSVFRNKNIIDILKIALSDHKSRTITWADSTKRTRKDSIPMRFEFTSTVIFISNNTKFDKNLKNRSKIVHFEAEKIECLEWVRAHFDTFLDIPMEYKMTVYSFLKENIGRFRTMDFRTFKNAMYDFLINIEVRKADVNDNYWKKVVLSNAGF